MADNSKIEWTDATWNPVTGCSVVSPGCTNCYAMRLAGTRLRDHPSRAGLTTESKAGPVWNGKVRLNEAWLDQPLRWRRPRKVFVCAHGDLFHEAVPDEWIDRVFAVMALAPQHTFQVLTKRAARMREYLTSKVRPFWRIHLDAAADPAGLDWINHPARGITPYNLYLQCPLPLPNVWLGVSAEDQARADERIPDLQATPAEVRFVSLEPLLGLVDLTRVPAPIAGDPARKMTTWDALRGTSTTHHPVFGCGGAAPSRLDWVIVGGESGPGARPMHPDWARSLRDQCASAGVAFHFKQWGEWEPRDEWEPYRRLPMTAITAAGDRVPDDVAPQDVGGQRFVCVGKARAGRLLDGREWNEVPR